MTRGRVATALTGLGLVAVPVLVGCASHDGSTPPPSTTSTASPTTSGGSPVDGTRITSLGDLAAAFGCPTSVTPITIPPTTTPAPLPPPVTSGTATVQPPATGTPTVSPAAVVCASRYAGGEALYLWYAPTPADRDVAVRAALARAKYVHAGPNWVAGGDVDPKMGSVGGEVYR
ncbi:hypothetical protein [Lapillicoccus jejuensis]|uniref:Lipoprotein n=1 Tax=Lapillicoccus jejuensis TaxID=402171 RepID=A0A542DXF8_9MICO|nr:hypothetical protein [Lapillicoccus jejuensis]TQJ07766.1 hypothetical protein FB458_0834 [Lapillicoccus jejuensis]